jgi:malonyl-CoA O-methyltransferase
MNQVRQSFNRAASSYDAVGTLQHQVATSLTALIKTKLSANFDGRLLDAGCGTGYCLAQLVPIYPAAEFIAVDFAERMLDQLPVDLQALGINANLENLPVCTGKIDAYLSSLAWQWCDPALAAKEATRILKPQGDLFVSTLLSGTFQELAHGLQACGLNPDQHLLRCTSSAQIQSALAAADIEILSLASTQMTTWHENFKALRHSIRGVGANHLPNHTTPVLTRQTLTQLVEAYEGLRTSRGLPLSYEVLTIHARKR